MNENIGYVNPSKIKFLPEPQEEQSKLNTPEQVAVGLATKAVQAPFNIANLGTQAAEYVGEKLNLPKPGQENKNEWWKVKGPSQIIKDIPGQIEQTVEKIAGKGSTSAKHPLNKAAQLTVGNWPVLAATGGGVTAPKLAADFIGSLFQVGAQELGSGPIGQIMASTVGQIGFGKVAGLFNKSLKNPGVIDTFKSDLYKKEPELGSKFKVSTKSLQDSIGDIKSKLEIEYPHKTKFNSEASNRVKDILEKTEKKLGKPYITGSELYQIQKDLNKVYIKPDSIEGKYFNQVLGSVKDSLDKQAVKHPSWGKIWKEADQLHSLQNWQSGLTDALDKQVNSGGRIGKILDNKVGRYALAAMSGVTNLADLAIEQGSRPGLLLNHLGKSKEGQQVLWEIVGNSAKRDFNALNKSLYKFNKIANDFEKTNPEEKVNYIDPNRIKFL